MFLGSAIETSVGPFALTSLVMAQQVNSIAPEIMDMPAGEEKLYASIAVILTLSFWTGLLLIIMSICRLGWVMTLISEPALSAYTNALIGPILLAQLANVLKLTVPADSTLM